MNLAPFFNPQFLGQVVDGFAAVAAAYQLFAFESGTTTPADVYQDEAGETVHTHPITLDDDGRVPGALFLDPTVEYTFELRRPVADGGAVVHTFDNVAGVPQTTAVVTSVNGQTGAVVLEADDIDFATTSDAAWFDAATLGAAIDQLIEKVDGLGADEIAIADADGHFEGDTVEEVLTELAEKALPATGADGQALVVVSGAPAWVNPRTSYALDVTDGSPSTRDVVLSAGTWRIVLETRAALSVEGVTTVISQSCEIGGITVSTAISMDKASGFGHMFAHGADLGVGTLVVATEDDYTMEINAISHGGAGTGTSMRLEKL